MNVAGVQLRSAVYECTVRHERLHPKRHAFSYRVFYLAIDLDELPELARSVPSLAINRSGTMAFWEKDYFPTNETLHQGTGLGNTSAASAQSLKERVLDWCAAHGLPVAPAGRVIAVSIPRILGYGFNPVSFYLCIGLDGQPAAAVAEVTNTFGERKLFPIPGVTKTHGQRVFEATIGKNFYVSPFSKVDGAFTFRLHPLGERLAFLVDEHEAGRRSLHSTLVGRRQPLTSSRLRWLLLRHPALTLKVIAMIHWEAARLWAKRVPFFRKAESPDRQRDLYRPHASLIQHSP